MAKEDIHETSVTSATKDSTYSLDSSLYGLAYDDVAGAATMSANDDYAYGERGVELPSETLKIIEIKNTKVINQNSDFSEGRVVYKIPEKMKIRSTYKVLVRIAKSKSVVSVYDSLQGTVRTSIIPVTQTMEVKLIDPSPDDRKAFEIVTENDAVQIIENGDTYTEWSWSVTPIKVGKSNLKIVVSVIRDGNKKDVVYEDSVEVEKDLPNQIKFFFWKYWQWLLSTLIIPFGIWLYKKRKGDDPEGKKKKKPMFTKRKHQ